MLHRQGCIGVAWVSGWRAILPALCIMLTCGTWSLAQNTPARGVLLSEPGVFAGYTLLSPLQSTKTFLIDAEGRVVHTWTGAGNPASVGYLLDNGHLLRPCVIPQSEQPMSGAAAGGRIQEFDWDGNIVWDFKFANDKFMQHHDITRMPNGNILMIVWDRKSKADAVAMGRRAEGVGNFLMSDSIVEIKPTGPTTGEIVWQWNLWDHLIQDFDRTKPGFGRVAAKPELVDLNFGDREFQRMLNDPAEVERLRSLGYLGAGAPQGGERDGNNPPAAPAAGGDGRGGARGPGGDTDWTHTNAVAYNAELDQIMLCIHNFHEIWIIDHSTTTAQAASHAGGKSGKGGDLLYRWGNPRAYRSGTNVDQKLFAQHNAHWIPKGLPGENHVIIFNNGQGRPDGTYSTIEEIVLPVDKNGAYALEPGLAWGPEETHWTYSAPVKTDLYSSFISGAHRLPNGNTLICAGASGTLFEVTADKKLVWKFQNSFFADGQNRGGGNRRGGPPPGPPGADAPPGPPPGAGGPGPRDGRGGGNRGNRGGGGGGPQGTSLFRAYRIALDHPALAGKTLMPGPQLEEVSQSMAAGGRGGPAP